MIIYEFSTWGAYKSDNGLFSITEIEVEEKPKSYIGKYTRILKSDIDKLQTHYGNRMYRLDNNPQAYIEAVLSRNNERLKIKENDVKRLKMEIGYWENLLRKEDEGK